MNKSRKIKNGEATKLALLEAFDKSEEKTISGICRALGLTRPAYYFHFYKDAEFRRQILTKQAEHLTRLANGQG